MNRPLLIAKISGLKNAPQYNDCRGIILGVEKPDQNGNLRQPFRMFGHDGKLLEVRVDNLKCCRDLEEWRIPKLESNSLLERIRAKRDLGEEDSCSEFSVKLWAGMSGRGE